MDVRYTATERKPDREEELATVGVDTIHVDLPMLLRECDFVSLYVPLVESMHHLIRR